MLHNDTLPSVDLSRTLERRPRLTRLRHLLDNLANPIDLTMFFWCLAVLAVCGAGASLHIWSSMRLAEAEIILDQLQTRYAEQERANAEFMWHISQYSRLTDVQNRATAMGLIVSYDNDYIPSLEPLVATLDSSSLHDQRHPYMPVPLLSRTSESAPAVQGGEASNSTDSPALNWSAITIALGPVLSLMAETMPQERVQESNEQRRWQEQGPQTAQSRQ